MQQKQYDTGTDESDYLPEPTSKRSKYVKIPQILPMHLHAIAPTHHYTNTSVRHCAYAPLHLYTIATHTCTNPSNSYICEYQSIHLTPDIVSCV